jgi:hypothetical protein
MTPPPQIRILNSPRAPAARCSSWKKAVQRQASSIRSGIGAGIRGRITPASAMTPAAVEDGGGNFCRWRRRRTLTPRFGHVALNIAQECKRNPHNQK